MKIFKINSHIVTKLAKKQKYKYQKQNYHIIKSKYGIK